MNEHYYSGSIFIIILVITEDLKCFIKMVISSKPRIVWFAFAIVFEIMSTSKKKWY